VAVLAVSSLALAIGFSTAAFSVLDAYAFREMPVREPSRLVTVSALTREKRVGRQSIQKMLCGVTADDPATFVAASAVVALVACAAALRPALRAARVDPMTALRHE
jgi:ABC-type antimicrobial peptide transport system permease subunit